MSRVIRLVHVYEQTEIGTHKYREHWWQLWRRKRLVLTLPAGPPTSGSFGIRWNEDGTFDFDF